MSLSAGKSGIFLPFQILYLIFILVVSFQLLWCLVQYWINIILAIVVILFLILHCYFILLFVYNYISNVYQNNIIIPKYWWLQFLSCLICILDQEMSFSVARVNLIQMVRYVHINCICFVNIFNCTISAKNKY